MSSCDFLEFEQARLTESERLVSERSGQQAVLRAEVAELRDMLRRMPMTEGQQPQPQHVPDLAAAHAHSTRPPEVLRSQEAQDAEGLVMVVLQELRSQLQDKVTKISCLL